MDVPDGFEFRTADDVDTSFAEAVVHARCHRVLGFKLRPFSLWHAANLDFVESPFAGHKKPLNFGALYVAARICQLKFPRVFRRVLLENWLEFWKVYRYRSLKKKSTGYTSPLMLEINKFSAYIGDYAVRPEFMDTESSVPVRTPWYLFEAATFKRYNPEATWAQCWDTEVGWTGWANAAMHEAHGNKIELVTPEYRKAFKQAET